MRNIDFLPNRYRETYAARAAVVRRWTIVLGLASIITPLAIYQYVTHRSVVMSVVQVEPEFLVAQQKSKQLADLRAKLELARGQAALLVYLDHPWPRTRILAALQEPLPESVRLTNIQMINELKAQAALGGARGRARRASEQREAGTEDATPAALRDLARLTEERANYQTVVTLSGLTTDTTDLHVYVARLRTTGLFEKSELRSLEAVPGREDSKAQNFEIRLVLAPGYSRGLPAEAPAAPAAPVATTGDAGLDSSNLASRP